VSEIFDGNAVVYCEGAFDTSDGKTAHGLVRFTNRYRVIAVIDSHCAGKDAGQILDDNENGIPVVATLEDAMKAGGETRPTHFVIGLAPAGGQLNSLARQHVKKALSKGLHVDSGLHNFLSQDPELDLIAGENGVSIRDIRKPPSRDHLHFFSGKIHEVKSFRVAVLGSDSAIGKRTTAWILTREFQQAGFKSEMIGTGQTSWLQGAGFGVILDSLINDFVSGEIEHAVWSAWDQKKPQVMIIEGQGSLMNPAYPGGFEILAAAKPHVIVFQHAPARKYYDGFPEFPIHPLTQQIQIAQLLSEKPVAAVTINHEALDKTQIPIICSVMEKTIGVPVFDVLLDGASGLVEILKNHMDRVASPIFRY
jgi:uncharacterized NAD-dependent epimerase/dehydratase family protein